MAIPFVRLASERASKMKGLPMMKVDEAGAIDVPGDDEASESGLEAIIKLDGVEVAEGALTPEMLATATSVELTDCLGIKKILAYSATSVRLLGCNDVEHIFAPIATSVGVHLCNSLRSINAPTAIYAEMCGCLNLLAIDMPSAKNVTAVSCDAIALIHAPEATWVKVMACDKLVAIRAPLASSVEANRCSGLLAINAPAAKITTYACPLAGEFIHLEDAYAPAEALKAVMDLPSRKQRYRDYLRSDAWKELRDKVLNRDDHTCQGCLSRPATQVHHLTYEHIFEEFALELVSLCALCHARIHGKEPQDRFTDAKAAEELHYLATRVPAASDDPGGS
jgi:hypothetical protein